MQAGFATMMLDTCVIPSAALCLCRPEGRFMPNAAAPPDSHGPHFSIKDLIFTILMAMQMLFIFFNADDDL